jgi:hypothetical protein
MGEEGPIRTLGRAPKAAGREAFDLWAPGVGHSGALVGAGPERFKEIVEACVEGLRPISEPRSPREQ